jgi:hypothetical protein
VRLTNAGPPREHCLLFSDISYGEDHHHRVREEDLWTIWTRTCNDYVQSCLGFRGQLGHRCGHRSICKARLGAAERIAQHQISRWAHNMAGHRRLRLRYRICTYGDGRRPGQRPANDTKEEDQSLLCLRLEARVSNVFAPSATSADFYAVSFSWQFFITALTCRWSTRRTSILPFLRWSPGNKSVFVTPFYRSPGRSVKSSSTALIRLN